MIVHVKSRTTGKVIGKRYVCHCCGKHSKTYRSGRGFPVGWVDRWETNYSLIGNRRRTAGQVNNYYCGLCIAYGANAHVVALVTKKVLAKFKAKT